MKAGVRRTTIWLIAAVFMLAACDQINPPAEEEPTEVPIVVDDFAVIAEGNLVPSQFVELSFTTGGEIVEVLVEEGDRVEAGQVLARLENFESLDALEAAVAGAQLELLSATQALEALNDAHPMLLAQTGLELATARDALHDAEYNWRVQQPGNRASGDIIDAAEANLVLAENQVERAQDEFNHYSGRPDDDPGRALALSNLSAARQQRDAILRQLNWYKGTPTEIDQSLLDAELAFAQTDYEEIQELWQTLQAGPDPDDIALAEERIANAQAQLAAAQTALADYDKRLPEIEAPIAGTVVSTSLKKGEMAVPGQPAIVIADFSEWLVETDNLTEIEVVDIAVGETVMVVPDALPSVELAGTVQTISDIFEVKRGDVTYTAKIRLDDEDPRLRWGMTVVVTFDGA